jgi:hypothetical protein
MCEPLYCSTHLHTQPVVPASFTYLMDEHDNEWLDKNNEEACGEGSSAQGAVSTSGTTMRTSQCSAKAKGKEPNIAQPIVIWEDEFELVMGLFEKVTHKNTKFLHHVCHCITCSHFLDANCHGLNSTDFFTADYHWDCFRSYLISPIIALHVVIR